MPVFKICSHYVEAETEEDAQRISTSMTLVDGAGLFVRDSSGRGSVLPVPDGGFIEIWAKHGDSIRYAGKVTETTGDKIMRAAVESMALGEREKGKLSQNARKVRIARKHANEQEVIDKFEESIPKVARVVYDDVMTRMEAHTVAYKIEIIDTLAEKNVNEVKPHNWLPILIWFRDRVLVSEEGLPTDERRTFFALRAAFVTAAARMVKENVRSASTVKIVAQDGDHDDDFWNRYAEDKSGS